MNLNKRMKLNKCFNVVEEHFFCNDILMFFRNDSNHKGLVSYVSGVPSSSPITLVVAKCWDPNPKGYFTIPRQEPVRPIDPSAWVAHTNAMQGQYGRGPMSPSLSTVTSTTSSLTSSIQESERKYNGQS